MTVTVVEPDLRFDRSAWDPVASRPPFETVYTCPQCDERIGFRTAHFPVLPGQRGTNLPTEVATRFTREASTLRADDLRSLAWWAEGRPSGGPLNLEGRPFLDWLCPRCTLPARVYATYWAGGSHETGVKLLAVLEALSRPGIVERGLTRLFSGRHG
jgi:hypothetical protein